MPIPEDQIPVGVSEKAAFSCGPMCPLPDVPDVPWKAELPNRGRIECHRPRGIARHPGDLEASPPVLELHMQRRKRIALGCGEIRGLPRIDRQVEEVPDAVGLLPQLPSSTADRDSQLLAEHRASAASAADHRQKACSSHCHPGLGAEQIENRWH